MKQVEAYHIVLDTIDTRIHLPDPGRIIWRRIPLDLPMTQPIHPQYPHLLKCPLRKLPCKLTVHSLDPLSPHTLHLRIEPPIIQHLQTAYHGKPRGIPRLHRAHHRELPPGRKRILHILAHLLRIIAIARRARAEDRHQQRRGIPQGLAHSPRNSKEAVAAEETFDIVSPGGWTG